MEGSGDEEPGADGPLQRLVKRQRKEKRELQGEGRRGPAKGGWGRGERSLRRPPRRGWGGGGGGETQGGPGLVRRSQPGTWRGDAPRRRSWKPRREKLGGSGGGRLRQRRALGRAGAALALPSPGDGDVGDESAASGRRCHGRAALPGAVVLAPPAAR